MKRAILLAAGLLSLSLALPSLSAARDKYDCQEAWSRAVRSYLTQNQIAGPDGKMPKDMDEAELNAQKWAKAFAPACNIEMKGNKKEARIEAAMIGVQILSKLDPKGCTRFLDSYMQSTRAQDICSMGTTASTADLRKQISSSIPER